jgi:hypothetical protein
MVMIADAGPWYLSPNFLPAAFGLLGVVVGGLITATTSYLLGEKRGRREREREERERSIQIKRAARMIDAHFSKAYACATAALEKNYYWDRDVVHLGLKGWDDYAAILAPALLSDAWLKVCLDVDAVRYLNTYRESDAARAPKEPMFPPISKEIKPGVERAVAEIDAARESLAPICYE